MILFGRLLTVSFASVMFAAYCPPAVAVPSHRSEEWWFDAWEIENKVWPLTQGQGVTIGLIDTGVSASLPELRGVVTGKRITASGITDDDTDHDVSGGGHGTAMAALIAGQGGESGMVGIAPRAKILSISDTLLGFGTQIRYAVDHGARIINVSQHLLAARCSEETQAAVDYALRKDAVIVAASGNDGPDSVTGGEPGNCPGVVTVGGLDANLNIWDLSSPGDNVMLAAPAKSVGTIGRRGAFTWRTSGTSGASALTAGVVALIRSRYPDMSAREVVRRLLATAKDVGPKGWDRFTGYGAVIPYLALTAEVPESASNPVFSRIDGQDVQHGAGQRPRSAGPPVERSDSDGTGNWKIAGIASLIVVFVGGAVVGTRFFVTRNRAKRRVGG